TQATRDGAFADEGLNDGCQQEAQDQRPGDLPGHGAGLCERMPDSLDGAHQGPLPAWPGGGADQPSPSARPGDRPRIARLAVLPLPISPTVVTEVATLPDCRAFPGGRR